MSSIPYALAVSAFPVLEIAIASIVNHATVNKTASSSVGLEMERDSGVSGNSIWRFMVFGLFKYGG